MFGSEILEVAVGMCLLFLFMSIIASALKEILEAWLKMRSKDLERGLGELLGSENLKAFYEHPAIAGLYRGTYDAARAGGRLPSYIPSRQFAIAMMQLVATGGLRTGLIAQGSAAPPAQGAPAAPAVPPIPAPPAAAPQAPVPGAPPQAPAPPQTLADLRAMVAAIQEPRVKAMLSHILDEAGDDLAKARKGFEAWFDGSMDRVSGWYKRRAQVILFFLGLGSAVTFNVDAITVAKRLLTDKALRAAVVAQSEKLTTPPPQGGKQAAPAGGQAPADPEALRLLREQGLAGLQSGMRTVGYPIGWAWGERPWLPLWPLSELPYPAPQSCLILPPGAAAPSGYAKAVDPSDLCLYGLGWSGMAAMALGWFITALAVMLGAPFWFDLLNKVMVIRSTVKPREKSREEGSEDRRNA